MLFLLIAFRINGKEAFVNEQLEEGLVLLAGMDQAPGSESIRACWPALAKSEHEKFQLALLQLVAGQRLLDPATMHVFQVDITEGKKALIAADESATTWPLACVVDRDDDIASIVSTWQSAWENATGVAPRVILDDCEPGRKAFLDALQALDQGQTGNLNLDLTIGIVTCVLLRLWARWLRGFSNSSIPFLLENLIRRKGTISTGPDALVVQLEPRPLDLVVELAGYLSELERVLWLPGKRIKFSFKGA
jgi:hypothetical protein